MNCDAVEDLLLDYVEQGLDPDKSQSIDEHLKACEPCRLALRQTRELVGALDDAKSLDGNVPPSRGHGPSFGPGTVLGDFELLGEIGRGGMGVVYRARQCSLNRTVALKVLPALAAGDARAVERFRKEARAAAKLHHTNIVPIYAQGEYDGHFYYAMELIDGASLDQLLKNDRPDLSASGSSNRTRQYFESIARQVAAVAEGLEYAHQQGVLHRDIKPQNLMMASDGQLRVTDFGLSRLLDEPGLTVSGETVGTPAYMAPEVVTGASKADARSDVYSLGVTLYELLARRRPFEGATRDQVFAQICTKEPRSPRKLDPAVPVDLETICLRAMEKSPARRYSTAGLFAAELRRYAEDRPIISRRVGRIEKSLKWVRRHPALATVCGLGFAIVIGGSLWVRQAKIARHATADSLVQKAFDLLAYDDYREPAEAQRFLSEAASLGPRQRPFRIASGYSHILDNPGEAVANLEWATQHDPSDTETMYLLAWALRQRDDGLTPPARSRLEKADRLGGPRTAAAHFFRGQALVRQDPDEAIAEFRAAKEQKPNYTQALLHLGRGLNHWTYHHRKHENFGEQERVLLNARDLQGGRAYPCYLLSIAYRLSAEIYKSLGKKVEAEQHYRKALQFAMEAETVEPTSPRGYAVEGEYWESRRDYGRAIAARDRGEKYCVKPDALGELRQYRWRPLYWEHQYDRALRDLADLARTPDRNDAHACWYRWFFPALIKAEAGQIDSAQKMAWSMAREKPRDFRSIVSSACLLRILHKGDEADRLLAQYGAAVDFAAARLPTDPPQWPQQIFSLCRGQTTLSTLEAMVNRAGGDTLPLASAYFVSGCRELENRQSRAALEQFRKCEATYDYEDYCYMARVFIRRMERDPAWPAWR